MRTCTRVYMARLRYTSAIASAALSYLIMSSSSLRHCAAEPGTAGDCRSRRGRDAPGSRTAQRGAQLLTRYALRGYRSALQLAAAHASVLHPSPPSLRRAHRPRERPGRGSRAVRPYTARERPWGNDRTGACFLPGCKQCTCRHSDLPPRSWAQSGADSRAAAEARAMIELHVHTLDVIEPSESKGPGQHIFELYL